jgi:hypothetical protein
MMYELYNPQQAHTVLLIVWKSIKETLQANKKMVLIVREQSKSREQEKLYHELIGQIAKQAQHLGAKWDAESWKRLLVDQFCKDAGIPTGKVIPSLDGSGIVQLGFQTRSFTKEQASEFVEWLLAWSAENGIDTQ